MTSQPSTSRRQANKQDKLERITVAAQTLFATKGITDVTTSQIAREAGVAAGTLFLYAKTKGELLFLAQNASYRQAHQEGVVAAKLVAEPIDALIDMLTPIVECNREHVENGRTYLREVVFGSVFEQHRLEAIGLMAETENQVVRILAGQGEVTPATVQAAKAVMAITFLTLSSPQNVDVPVPQLMQQMRAQFGSLSF